MSTDPELPRAVYRVSRSWLCPPRVESALLLRRSGGWRYYRDPADGREWKENGPRFWEPSPGGALRREIDFVAELLAGSPLLPHFGGKDRVRRRLVATAVLLAYLWASAPTS